MTLTELFINAVCTGMGTGVGSYLATKYAITHVQRIEERMKKGRELLTKAKP